MALQLKRLVCLARAVHYNPIRFSTLKFSVKKTIMPSTTIQKMNPDIAKERRSATFDVEEFAVWWCGDAKRLQEKREIAKAILEAPELEDEYPSYYKSYQDMYDDSIRKISIFAKLLKKLQNERNPGGSDIFPNLMSGLLLRALLAQGSSIDLHLFVFVPALKNQGTPEQIAKWLPRALNFEYIATYAQTELGHGTFLRGLETRADYDPKTEEFVLNSPTLTAYKWWPGGLGHTVNYSLVVAQMYINNKSHGIQMFLVPLRDEETHMPLPGIIIGEIGNKMSFQTVNNGYLGFKDFRIPRMNMLMKNAQVLPDGTFKKSAVSVLTYLTMLETRVNIISQSLEHIALASTIATRYSAVRRQGVINPKEPEHQIMDHLTQQMKLFPEIAKTVVLKISADYLREMFAQVNQEIMQQKYDRLPEMHAMACSLKAVSTKDSRESVETLRLACGGHGYMLSSYLPILYCSSSAASTYEGENTVLLLQTARFLMKAWAIALEGGELVPTVAYLANAVNSSNLQKWDGSSKGIVRALQFVAASKTRVAFNHLEERKKQMIPEEAANLTAIELVEAAELHGRSFLAATALEQIEGGTNKRSEQLNALLRDLLELYLVDSCLKNMGVILRFIPLTESDINALQFRLEKVLAKIRPNAVAIVDGFDYHDRMLNSVLGSYDGNVYERIFEMAQRSPMNKIPVQKSFHEYLKPFMRSNL